MDFNITLPARSCFGRLAETVAYGLGRSGNNAQITDYLDLEKENILFAAHLVSPEMIPSSTIIYNFEQVGAFPAPPLFYSLAKRCKLWDYSSVNVTKWKEQGALPKLVPVGYVPEMTRIKKGIIQEDVDVLFYGTVNERRMAVLRGLARAGLRMAVVTQGMVGPTLDAQIARAKVVLNMHYYEAKVFEIARVFYLLSNSKCIVTEESLDDRDYAYLTGGICRAPYEGLVEAVVQLVRNEERRRELESEGFRRFSLHTEESILHEVLYN